MKQIEFEVGEVSAIYTTNGIELEVAIEDHGDTDTNGYVVATYTFLVDLELGFKNYEIINKHYENYLTIKQTKQCDDFVIKAYENNYFEEYCIEAYEEHEEWGWFI